MTTEVTLDDKKTTIDGSKETGAPAKKKLGLEALEGKTPLEIQDILFQNPDLYEEAMAFLENNDKGGSSSLGTDDQPALASGQPGAAAAPAAETNIADDKEVSITIKPSDLGTYAKGRSSLQEAIQELVKGKQEADKTIEFYKSHKIPTIEKTLTSAVAQVETLQRELAALKQGAPAPGKPGEKAAEVEMPTMPELPDEIDFLDPDHQKTVSDYLKSVPNLVKALTSQIQSVRSEASAGVESVRRTADRAPVNSEYDEIRLLQANPETEGLLSTKTDIEQLDTEYYNFVKNMASLSGIQQVVDNSGNWTEQTRKALAFFMDQESVEGKAIREACVANNVKLPEEYPILSRIYQARGLRQKYLTRSGDGSSVPISYDEAFKLLRAQNPSITPGKTKVQLAVEEQERLAAAQKNRDKFSKEPRSTDGAQPNSLTDLTAQKFADLVRKDRKTYTPAEKEFVTNVLRDEAKMSDAEITSWFK
jgi:hypothetical protein